MFAALGVCGLVAAVLAAEVVAPRLRPVLAQWRARLAVVPAEDVSAYDPGRERRAEQRARALLRSCVNEEDWAMYRDLGFLRVWGNGSAGAADGHGVAPYAYLIYPHKPIVAYVPQSSRLLSEYCVDFPDRERPYGSTRLPPSDDVLAKWMALIADERRLIESANLHLAGRQHDPDAVRADIAALARWDSRRERQLEATRTPAP
ncbi:MAG TPA: hypothetical protein VN740_06860 [Solirubrobacteraceae bacterium]|nr:hypothetical protein [Solirubrobacteraceae bacterium]